MPALNTVILWTAIVIMTTMAGNAMGSEDKSMGADSLEKINSGVSAGEKIVTFFNSLDDPKKEKAFSVLGTMSSFLGAYGGLISFALLFIPKSESAELKFMKKQFAEVNQKLDRITSELDNIKHLIKYENQHSVYLDSASKILFAHKQLFVFLDELEKAPCKDKKNCKRVRARIASRYVEHFNVKQDIFKIMNGAVKPTSAFGDPILRVVSKTFKCDVGRIDHVANSILKLSFKAQQVILAYEKLIGSQSIGSNHCTI